MSRIPTTHAASAPSVVPQDGATTVELCPTCNGEMHWRRNRTSQTWFMGCKKWPSCNGTRDGQGHDTRISPQRQNRLQAMLKAAVLDSEDECLTFSADQLAAVEHFELHLDEIKEERKFLLTCKRKA